MTVTVRLRGEFKVSPEKEQILLLFDEPDVTCQAVIDRLSSVIPQESLRSAALFRDGRLLRASDRVTDGDTVHVLSPYAGG